MFGETPSLGWDECNNKLVNIMSTNRIFQCRMKRMYKVFTVIVPKVAERLQARWDAAASLTVMELELGATSKWWRCRLFKKKTMKVMTG